MQDDFSSEMIDLGKYLNILKTNWKTIMWWTIGGFVLGCLVALGTPRKYVVTSKLAPELSSTATNRLSSMASLIGMSSSVLGTTDAVYPMVYPDLVKSPEFIADLFDTPVSFKYKGAMKDTTLYRYLEEYQNKSAVGAVLSLPGKVVGWATSIFMEDEDAALAGKTAVDPFQFKKKQGKIFRALQKMIVAEIDKKTLVVTVSVTMGDPLVCATVAKAVIAQIKDYVTEYRTEKAKKDVEYYQKLYDEAKIDYYIAQGIYSKYVDTHQSMVLQSVLIERERLHNEANLKYSLYNSTAQQLQAAQAKVQQETPVFAEIITPTVPLKPANSRKKIALAAAFLGLCAGTVWVLIRRKE